MVEERLVRNNDLKRFYRAVVDKDGAFKGFICDDDNRVLERVGRIGKLKAYGSCIPVKYQKDTVY